MDKKVTIFSSPTCSYCKMTKEFLNEKNIPFTDIDVTKDEKARDDMIKKTGQMGVPVVDIDGEIIIGFNKDKISSALGIA